MCNLCFLNLHKGISVKYPKDPKKSILYLDTAGVDKPVEFYGENM